MHCLQLARPLHILVCSVLISLREDQKSPQARNVATNSCSVKPYLGELLFRNCKTFLLNKTQFPFWRMVERDTEGVIGDICHGMYTPATS